MIFHMGCTTVLCIGYYLSNEVLYCFTNLMNVTLIQLMGYPYGDYIYTLLSIVEQSKINVYFAVLQGAFFEGYKFCE